MRVPKFRALDLTAKYRVKRTQLHQFIHHKPMWHDHPTVIQLDTQNICNLKCVYCNPQNTFIKEHGKLPLKTIEHILKYVKDKGWFINYVPIFMNGDPLLEKRLPIIAQMVKSYLHAKVIIFTNGVAYPNKHLLLDRNIDLINFTISAATQETYLKVHGADKFAEALKTVLWFSQHKKLHQRIRIYYILNKHNMHELEAWKDLFSGYEQNVRPCFLAEDIKEASSQARGNLELKDFLQSSSTEYDPTSSSRPCPCWDSLNISYKGDIMQCMDLPYEHNWGNVQDVDIEEVWHKRNKLGLNHPACKTCQMKHPQWERFFKN